jgi:hypothetical protein
MNRNNNRWGAMEYLTVLGILNLVFSFLRLGAAGTSILGPVVRIGVSVLVGTWLLIGAWKLYEMTPAWVIVLVSITLFACVVLAIQKARAATATKKQAEEASFDELVANYRLVRQHLADLHVHYYDFEKKNFSEWIAERGLEKNFLHDWDDAYRLLQIGNVTGKSYVCHLFYMSEDQVKAKRDAAWDKQRNAQRQAQLEKNALQRQAARQT